MSSASEELLQARAEAALAYDHARPLIDDRGSSSGPDELTPAQLVALARLDGAERRVRHLCELEATADLTPSSSREDAPSRTAG